MSNAHHHPHQEADTGQVLSPYAHRVRAIEALLVDKGILTEPEIQDRIAYMESRSPENGARLVARAWVDSAFKARLLSNTKAAAMELGIDASGPSSSLWSTTRAACTT